MRVVCLSCLCGSDRDLGPLSRARYVASEFAKIGTELKVDVRGKQNVATVSKMPFGACLRLRWDKGPGGEMW